MGDFLSTPNKEKVSEDGENDLVRFGASGMQGWRKKMEDSHISDLNIGDNKDQHVFGVFDGHGGREVAQFVKRHFTEELCNNQNFQAGKCENALTDNFLKMDQILTEPASKIELKQEEKKSKEEEESDNQNQNQERNKQLEMYKSMFDPRNQEDCDIAFCTGCTASVCLISPDYCYFANAGDSRAIIVKSGIAYPMTIDHKPDLESEKTRIYKAEGWVSEGRVKGNLNLSRSLGDLQFKQNKKFNPEDQMITSFPEVTKDTFEDADFVVIACDGVWDCKTNQEVADFVWERLKKNLDYKLSKIIEELFDEIVAPDIYSETGVGCDNMTCIIIQFKKSK